MKKHGTILSLLLLSFSLLSFSQEQKPIISQNDIYKFLVSQYDKNDESINQGVRIDTIVNIISPIDRNFIINGIRLIDLITLDAVKHPNSPFKYSYRDSTGFIIPAKDIIKNKIMRGKVDSNGIEKVDIAGNLNASDIKFMKKQLIENKILEWDKQIIKYWIKNKEFIVDTIVFNRIADSNWFKNSIKNATIIKCANYIRTSVPLFSIDKNLCIVFFVGIHTASYTYTKNCWMEIFEKDKYNHWQWVGTNNISQKNILYKGGQFTEY
jgi:hypothetical protein